MRHRKSGCKLNRDSAHRTAMFKNMARALLTYEQIRTTEVKAKELRRVVDKLITLALRDDLHCRRQAYKVLGSHQLVQRLFDEIGPRFEGGQGGYTRIVKLSQPRTGDCAPMVIIELTKKAADAPVKAEEKGTSPEKETSKKAAAKAPAKKKAEEPADKAEQAPAAAPDESGTTKEA
ncbi:MAG: 50S ribosomal protein L17 [Pseudodesulfovibrio sp.]|uniref:Large ribosomal subunit protein bL17 n=1 Tax=Pseudodesulfovibrio aespoeensis (strain ATCC 700646 / DSM 10631 / Aspo-2) TaxID=643562 RepID=E6VT74_PSEA9|nr:MULTISPECIES: 50S ribosomal protein L17 [Pseudodesulfovibrio]ADU63233.1 ribosomal protein L17 [Pseudodesulfovibrio aespoeensis Aspo-2]MBU4190714.1 50S ribosomal protein L17 [Pseudomonadota bacterium]MBU4377945.1 50S ribosomal protein L17 [Pseudomonadota bacterium]MBU4475130.1 50S ribosomal protein L17 [Pseudomonadota bacterium]MBU4516196.1 50S ribosomal protein L17 [Pseudomonadota bacterium]